MDSKPAPRPRGEASRITPICIVADSEQRLSSLGSYAQAAVRHGAHQSVTDEQLIAWLFGYQLRALNLRYDGMLSEVHDEIRRRVAVAKAVVKKGESTGRLHRLQRMAYGHALTCRGVEVGIIDRMARRASSVGIFLLRMNLSDNHERLRVAAAASDQLLIDVRFWAHFIVDNAGQSSREALGVELWDDISVLRQEIRDRIEELHDPELNPEALHGGRPSGPHTPVPQFRDADAILEYRLAHNLAVDHPFWTDDRVLSALHIGME
jgi:hypothetical protein